jgi:hypothetical protein
MTSAYTPSRVDRDSYIVRVYVCDVCPVCGDVQDRLDGTEERTRKLLEQLKSLTPELKEP